MSQGLSRRRAVLINPSTGEPLKVRNKEQQIADIQARHILEHIYLELKQMKPLLELEAGAGITIEKAGRKRKISQKKDIVEWLPRPEFSGANDGSQASSTWYQGSAFVAPVPIEFNRFIWKQTTNPGPGSVIRFSFYQSPFGGGGRTKLLATADAPAPGVSAAGNTVNLALTKIMPGVFFVLWGHRGSLGVSVQTWTLPSSLPLVVANVDANTHPAHFSATEIDADTAPETFDPRKVTAATASFAPIIRLINTGGLE